jgi:hypothetical protein
MPVWTCAKNLDPTGIFINKDSIPGPSSPWSVAIPTELPGPNMKIKKLKRVFCKHVEIEQSL